MMMTVMMGMRGKIMFVVMKKTVMNSDRLQAYWYATQW